MNVSKLYNSIKNEKFIDTDKRSSSFKTIVNNDLFDLFEIL